MYSQISQCPKCGAPIYATNPWHGTCPPPPIYSCSCRFGADQATSTESDTLLKTVKSYVETKEAMLRCSLHRGKSICNLCQEFTTCSLYSNYLTSYFELLEDVRCLSSSSAQNVGQSEG